MDSYVVKVDNKGTMTDNMDYVVKVHNKGTMTVNMDNVVKVHNKGTMTDNMGNVVKVHNKGTMTDNMDYVVKVHNKGTIRRLTLVLGEKQFSYEQLQSRIGNLFQLPASAQFVLTYTDKDGDVVTIAEDEDLKDALVLQKLNPLRVTIEHLQLGTHDDKVSSPLVQKELKSGEVTEQQQQSIQGEQIPQTLSKYLQAGLQMDPVANAEPGLNPGENTSAPEERVSKATHGAADLNLSDASSPASATAVDVANKACCKGATTTGTRFLVRMEAKRNDGRRQIHSGIQCHRCGMLPIAGPRLKSCKNPNYNLCPECFEATSAEENELCTKIDGLVYPTGYPAYVGRIREFKLQRANERMRRKLYDGQNSSPHSDEKNSTCAAAPAEAGNKTAAEEYSTGVLHQGVQCDDCGMFPIQGPRYKSSTRFDYDLCRSCFEKRGSNIIEYIRINRPLIIASGHPLVISEPMRRLPPCLRQCRGRWIWVLNQMVPGLAVDEAGAGEKAPAAGSDLEVGGDAVTSLQAEAAATENTSTSAPRLDIDSTPSVAKQADGTTEVQTPVDVEKIASSMVQNARNNAGKTAEVEEEIVQTPAVGAIGKEAGAEEAVQAPAVGAIGKEAGAEEAVQAPAVAARVEEAFEGPAVSADRDLSTKEGLMAKLAAMSFSDPKLNEELLGKNNFDLLRTLDDLFTLEEWDPLLGELQEMGFYDANMNRRLMFKYNGSVKRVVKQLVQMYEGEKLA